MTPAAPAEVLPQAERILMPAFAPEAPAVNRAVSHAYLALVAIGGMTIAFPREE